MGFCVCISMITYCHPLPLSLAPKYGRFMCIYSRQSPPNQKKGVSRSLLPPCSGGNPRTPLALGATCRRSLASVTMAQTSFGKVGENPPETKRKGHASKELPGSNLVWFSEKIKFWWSNDLCRVLSACCCLFCAQKNVIKDSIFWGHTGRWYRIICYLQQL